MTHPYKKKLIEVAIPLEAINKASSREKSIRHGHPSTLHLWWARRPLAACRAVLFAQLVDDPSEYVDRLLEDPAIRSAAEKELAERQALWEKRRGELDAAGPDSAAANTPEPTLEDCAADIERKRLFQIIEDLVKWENSTNEEVLERARAEIRRSCGGELPPIYDPFSGGCSIPLEAQRLGLPAYGSDLNPVAVMIGKAMIEIPPRFKDMAPVHPGGPERSSCRNAEGLAEDVKYYGEWMREKAFERIGHLYPQVDIPVGIGSDSSKQKATVIAWIWARTVPSPDPAFADVQVPLVKSFDLSTRKGRKAWVEPIKENGSYRFEIRTELAGDTRHDLVGTVNRSGGTCLMSGAAMPFPYIREQGKAGTMDAKLMAIVVEGKKGRIYLSPTAEQEQLAKSAKPDYRPDVKLHGKTRVNVANYGMDTFGDLFTERQLVALNTFSALVHEAREVIEADGLAAGLSNDPTPLRDGGQGAKAYAEAVSVYLAFAVDRAADAWSAQVSWRNSVEASRGTFARQALPMVWDFVELNPFSKSNGNWVDASINWIQKSLSAFCPSSIGTIIQGDAQTVSLQNNFVISTDPPYYDNIGYADLSDFFFCWMKPALAAVYPELFGVLATPKTEELIATPYRHGGKMEAEAFFLDGMGKAIANMAQYSSSKYPATIYYAFKQSEMKEEGISSTGWASFLEAVVDAGYGIVGTWPMRTEKPGRMIAVGTNALANSVVLVCRKKQKDVGILTRAEFIRALKRELPPALVSLQAANISPADMPQSAIGPGIGIFSRYDAVLESDDSPMSVKTALQLINRELDEYFSGIEGEFDAETRFAVTWFEQNGEEAGEYGTANNIATARGISVESVAHAGIVKSSAGKVRILKRDELERDWDPQTDEHLTHWECCQYLIRALDEGEMQAALLMKKMGAEKADTAKDLAYRLYDICDKKGWSRQATAYNGLIAVWSDLTAQAAIISDDVLGDDQLSFL